MKTKNYFLSFKLNFFFKKKNNIQEAIEATVIALDRLLNPPKSTQKEEQKSISYYDTTKPNVKKKLKFKFNFFLKKFYLLF